MYSYEKKSIFHKNFVNVREIVSRGAVPEK